MNTKEGTIIIIVSELSLELFTESIKYVSIGKLPQNIIASIITRYPEFSRKLSPDTDILFWVDRIKHIEKHKNDFLSPLEFEHCFKNIPHIIQNPDYISVHPNKNSISFIKGLANHTAVAIRLSSDGKLAFRTMYPLRNAQLTNYIKNGFAWKCM